jgi:hypothetical protein
MMGYMDAKRLDGKQHEGSNIPRRTEFAQRGYQRSGDAIRAAYGCKVFSTQVSVDAINS